jgi:hypothetical protein
MNMLCLSGRMAVACFGRQLSAALNVQAMHFVCERSAVRAAPVHF